jgi:hypothetical protein
MRSKSLGPHKPTMLGLPGFSRIESDSPPPLRELRLAYSQNEKTGQDTWTHVSTIVTGCIVISALSYREKEGGGHHAHSTLARRGQPIVGRVAGLVAIRAMTGHPRPVGYIRKIRQEEIVAELHR